MLIRERGTELELRKILESYNLYIANKVYNASFETFDEVISYNNYYKDLIQVEYDHSYNI